MSVVGIGRTAPTEGHRDGDDGTGVGRVYDEVAIQRMNSFSKDRRARPGAPHLLQGLAAVKREASAVVLHFDDHLASSRPQSDADVRRVAMLCGVRHCLVNDPEGLLPEK